MPTKLSIFPPAAVLALIFASIASPAAAETLFVTDILRLGLHRSSETNGRPLATLVSGTALEVLEKSRYAARVRTPDGDEGWVKRGYLVEDMPAQARLQGLIAERDRLARELADLRQDLSARERELAAIAEARQLAEQRAGTGENEVQRLRTENESLGSRLARYRFAVPWQWLVTITAATLVGGFLAGLWWLDHRSRQRHGGFRIY